MNDFEMEQFVSGGYFLVKASKPDWPELVDELLPAQIVSLSGCIAPHLSVAWGFKPIQRRAAADFGIPDGLLDDFTHWCHYEAVQQLDQFGMFFSMEHAQAFILRFLPDMEHLYLIGVGLHKDLLAANWDSSARVRGVEKRIAQQMPLDQRGVLLGYEVLSYMYSDFSHSWLCTKLHNRLHQTMGVSPNAYGLLPTFAQGNRIAEWLQEEDPEITHAEPEPYDTWALLSYPLM